MGDCSTCYYCGSGMDCWRVSKECTYKPIPTSTNKSVKPKVQSIDNNDTTINIRDEKKNLTAEAITFLENIKQPLETIYNNGIALGLTEESVVYLIINELYDIHIFDVIKKKLDKMNNN